MKQPAATSRTIRVALRGSLVRIVGAAALLLAAHVAAVAQETEPAPQAIPARVADKADRIQYVGPDTYILLDAEGRPQPVPGMTYEDFLAAWTKLQQPANANRERRYSIESIDIDGTTDGGHARLQFTARVHLLTDEPTEVPLGLLGAILRGDPRIGPGGNGGQTAPQASQEDDGSHSEYLYFNPERGGFVVHFEGKAGDRREVSLDLFVPLTRDGTETTLPLDWPRALSSKLTLTLDRPIGNAVVNEGTLLATEQTAEGGARLNVVGAMGSVRLTWQTGGMADGESATVLGATGALQISIDGRSVRSRARLTVQSYGGSFDRFRVRLPRGAQLVREEPIAANAPSPNYRITLEEQSSPVDAQSKTQGQIVLVTLPEKQRGPVTVELATEQPIGIEDGGPVVELGAFEVLGAVRQFGDLAVNVAGDWQARWDIGDYIRQVDPSEIDEALRQADLTAAFQYDRQPWALGMRITPRQFRVHVAPRYELEITPDEARLTVRLAYQLFGARAFEFHVGLAGWEIADNSIDSGGLVDQDRVQVTPDDVLVLPLAQSSLRRADVAFTVSRALPRDQAIVALPMPVPMADVVGTGELEVAGTAEVELRPDLAKSLGLTAMPATRAADTTDADGDTKHCFRTSVPETVFVAERMTRKREVVVKSAARVDLQRMAVQVEQRFDYSVRYEPISELNYEVPAQLFFDPEQSEIVLLSYQVDESGGERETPLSFVSTDTERETLVVGAKHLRVSLPQPRLGGFGVRIRFETKPNGDGANEAAWQIPLIQQTDGQMAGQTAWVRTPPTLAASIDTTAADSSWTALDAPLTSAGDETPERVQQYTSVQNEPSLPLIVRTVDRNLPSSTIVERVWLQTWFSSGVRQDRAAFRFRTTASETAIELPPQVSPDEVEVLLDARPAELLSRGTGRILVRAPQPTDNASSYKEETSHTLELRYRQPAHRGLIRRHRLTPPQIVGTTLLSDVYWQIVLPGDQHIVQSPHQMASVGQWQWLGSFWGRRPVLSQTDLEKWSSAAAHRGPAATDSAYLFSGLAPVSTIEILTAPRWLIVLAASAVVLAMVLAWAYIPRSWRGWAIAGSALLTAALGIAFPAPALLLAQAAVLGVVVSSISLLIGRLRPQPLRWPVTLSGGSTQRPLAPRGDSMLIPPMAAAASTAPTAPLIVPEPER